ncbi:hypothetical protein GCM10020255_063610 [Rhodococcus baikonurensis]
MAAFSSDVDLYVLDEPTSGLDPLMEAVFQDCVEEVAHAGKTVLLSSHILAEVEALCDRVSIIRDGRTVEEGTLSELRHLTRTSVSAETQRLIGSLDGLGGVHDAVIDGNHVTCEVDSAQLGPLMTYLVGFGIVALSSTPPTLEELFLRHYGDERARRLRSTCEPRPEYGRDRRRDRSTGTGVGEPIHRYAPTGPARFASGPNSAFRVGHLDRLVHVARRRQCDRAV